MARLLFPITLLILCALAGCRQDAMTIESTIEHPMSDKELASLETKKIFFGHQSVGDNILRGVHDLILRDPRIKLRIVNSPNPETVSGPALVDYHVGQNGTPESKNDDFAAIIAKGFGTQGGIAILKYCFVDIDGSTDVQEMFHAYQSRIDVLRQRYPLLRIVHTTVPLTTVEPAPVAWLKSVLGKRTYRDANSKRQEFNQLLRSTYANRDPIFDLAQVESTRPDGSRSYFRAHGQTVETLVPEYAADSGHLNELGRRAAAERLIRVLTTI